MTQYPNEKEPHPGWLDPQQGPPATQEPYSSRDGAPAPGGSSQYQSPPGPPPQGYFPPPQEPPPDYGYVQSHPEDRKGPPREVYLTPPPDIHPDGAPADAGPSSSSSSSKDNQGGIMMSLSAFFGNKGPPPMWSRQPPQPGQLPYNAFPPMCLISNGADLSNGFPELPPPCQLNPHPFATHDVTEEDWKRFLADVKKGGSLSPAQRIRSNVIPAITGVGFVTGFIASFAIEKKMKHKNRQAAGDVVDHWNHYFFGPRRMEVVLCQASERLSGRLGVAPIGDPNQALMANGLRRRTDDDSSSSSSSEDSHGYGHGHGHNNRGYIMTDKQARRAARRERRAVKRERRAERRERKARGEHQQPYQLFITAV